jgi:hypothetical protein
MLFKNTFSFAFHGAQATVTGIKSPPRKSSAEFKTNETAARKRFLNEDRRWRPQTDYSNALYIEQFRPALSEQAWQSDVLQRQYNEYLAKPEAALGLSVGQQYRCARPHVDRLNFDNNGELAYSLWFANLTASWLPSPQRNWQSNIKFCHWFAQQVTHGGIDNLLSDASPGRRHMTWGWVDLNCTCKVMSACSFELILVQGAEAVILSLTHSTG